ncbi:unnamed protein product [Musa acuminata var. zebrina]
MDHSVVIWVAGCLDLFQFLLSRILENSQYLVVRSISVPFIEDPGQFPVLNLIFSTSYYFLLVCFAEVEMLIEKLKLLNKPAVKIIKSEDGDIIYCVDIYMKPSLDHPLLKGHIIKMRPDDEHSEERDGASSNPTNGLLTLVWKPWHGVKKHAVRLSNNETFDLNAENLHAYGGLLATGDDILGAKAIINLWNPSVQQDSEFSSAKIWFRNWPTDRSNNIEAGWMVILFADSGRTTGCFNLLRPGFVQTSDKRALGASFTNVSTAGGSQFEEEEEESGKWWLVYGDNSTIGDWPTSLFDTLNDSAPTALFGGDVLVHCKGYKNIYK